MLHLSLIHILLGAEENRKILDIIKKYMEVYKVEPYCEASHTGLVRHALIRKGFTTGELMVCLVINGDSLPEAGQLVKELKNCLLYTSCRCPE